MPIPKNSPLTLVFRMTDATGADKTGTPTVRIAKNGAAATVATNAPVAQTGFGSASVWAVTLTADETNGAPVAFEASLSGAVTIFDTIYPEGDYTGARALNLDRLDAATSQSDVQAGLTAQGYTAGRAAFLDTLNGLVAAVWGYAGRTLAVFGDSTGVTTLLGRLTITRAGNLDLIDRALSTLSTYAGGDTPGTATLLTRIASALTITAGRVGLITEYDRAKNAASPAEVSPTIAFSPTINPTAVTVNPAPVTVQGGYTPQLHSAILAAIGTPQQSGAAVTLPSPAPAGYGGGSSGGGLSDDAAAQIAATLAAVSVLGSGRVVVLSPVLTNGDVKLARGFDYFLADGLAPKWSSDNWADLTGAQAVVLTVEGAAPVSGAVVAAGSGVQTVAVDVARDAFQGLAPGGRGYRLEATLANGHRVPLAAATIQLG